MNENTLTTAKGKLYIVATPIGNLSDITLRAIEILKTVDIILAEDTRHCARLLNHYQITTKKWSLHNFNEATQAQKIIALLQSGRNFALISDAGTPLISDPGWALVHVARENAIEVRAVPGACALAAALSVVSLPVPQFQFFGFLPVKSGARQLVLKKIKDTAMTTIFYESPHRLVAMLNDCQHILGDARHYYCVKELTKIHETVRDGSASDLLQWLQSQPEHLKGEFIIFIGPGSQEQVCTQSLEEAQRLLNTLRPHLPLNIAVKIAAQQYAVNKNQLYALAVHA